MGVLERRLVDPVENNELRAEVQHLDVGTSQIDGLGGRGVTTLEDQSQADVLESPSGEVGLVNAPILDDRSREGKLANPGHIGHRLWPRVGLNENVHGSLRVLNE